MIYFDKVLKQCVSKGTNSFAAFSLIEKCHRSYWVFWNFSDVCYSKNFKELNVWETGPFSALRWKGGKKHILCGVRRKELLESRDHRDPHEFCCNPKRKLNLLLIFWLEAVIQALALHFIERILTFLNGPFNISHTTKKYFNVVLRRWPSCEGYYSIIIAFELTFCSKFLRNNPFWLYVRVIQRLALAGYRSTFLPKILTDNSSARGWNVIIAFWLQLCVR